MHSEPVRRIWMDLLGNGNAHHAVPMSQPLMCAEGTVPYEPYGEGANAYVYFVSNTLGGQVAMLPYVTPEQVKVSRLLRRFLTGRLDAPVSSFPAFPGTEAHYLRALIARISAATVCCPKGYFLADEVHSKREERGRGAAGVLPQALWLARGGQSHVQPFGRQGPGVIGHDSAPQCNVWSVLRYACMARGSSLESGSVTRSHRVHPRLAPPCWLRAGRR